MDLQKRGGKEELSGGKKNYHQDILWENNLISIQEKIKLYLKKVQMTTNGDMGGVKGECTFDGRLCS